MVTHAKRSQTLPQVLNKEERKALLAAPSRKAPTGIRNRAMLGLMLNAGLRVSEVVGKENVSLDDLDEMGGLRLDHIDFDNGKLRVVNGKGKVDRNLFIDGVEIAMIKRWLAIRPQTEHDLMFTTLDGEKIKNRYVRSLLMRLGKRAGIKRNIYPHLLRHTYLTDVYKKTKDILQTQKIAGHKDLSSTTIYTHIFDSQIEETMKTLRDDD